MNEPTMETLARRLDRVERENRRLKLAGAVVLGAIAAVGLMGQATLTKVPNVVEAEKFILRDGRAKVRAEWVALTDATALRLFDKNGEIGATLHVLAEGSGLTLFDKDGKDRAALAVFQDEPFLHFYGKSGRIRVGVLDSPTGSGVILNDHAGTTRAGIGVKPDGRPSLALMNKVGKAIWSAP